MTTMAVVFRETTKFSDDSFKQRIVLGKSNLWCVRLVKKVGDHLSWEAPWNRSTVDRQRLHMEQMEKHIQKSLSR